MTKSQGDPPLTILRRLDTQTETPKTHSYLYLSKILSGGLSDASRLKLHSNTWPPIRNIVVKCETRGSQAFGQISKPLPDYIPKKNSPYLLKNTTDWRTDLLVVTPARLGTHRLWGARGTVDNAGLRLRCSSQAAGDEKEEREGWLWVKTENWKLDFSCGGSIQNGRTGNCLFFYVWNAGELTPMGMRFTSD